MKSIINYFLDRFNSKGFRFIRILLIICNDLVLVNLGLYLSYYLRIEYYYPIGKIINIFIFVSLIYLFLFFFFKIYKQFFRLFNSTSIKLYIKFFIFFSSFFLLFVLIDEKTFVPRSLIFIYPTLLFLLLIINRFVISRFLSIYKKNLSDISVIFGLDFNYNELLLKYANIQLYIDNSKLNKKRFINGISIIDSKSFIKNIHKLKFNKIIILDINLFNECKNEIRNHIISNQILVEKVSFHNNDIVRDTYFDFNYYFNRKSKIIPIGNIFTDKTILITGSGGSIGSAIVKQLENVRFKKLLLLDNSEYNLYSLSSKLNQNLLKNKSKIQIYLNDFNDKENLKFIFSKHKIDIIFHAAAYKHVPLIEENPFSAIKNNFLNTFEFLTFCSKKNVPYICIISSDKAVRPTNIMGASKRLSEIAASYLNFKQSNTKINSVRFGNVINSSGSVIPLFLEQIKNNKEITLTHKKITRFFMTIDEAANLVISVYKISKGGEVFLLDMGEQIKMYDLIRLLVQFSGKKLKEGNEGDLKIKTIGLRAGEKLYEELLIDNSSINTSLNNIYESLEKNILNKDFEILYKSILNAYKFKNKDKLYKILLNNELVKYKNSNG